MPTLQVHINKTGTLTALADGSASNPVWAVDNPAIYTVTPISSQVQPDGSTLFTAQVNPVALGQSNTVFSCFNGSQTLSNAITVQIIAAPAQNVTVTGVENP